MSVLASTTGGSLTNSATETEVLLMKNKNQRSGVYQGGSISNTTDFDQFLRSGSGTDFEVTDTEGFDSIWEGGESGFRLFFMLPSSCRWETCSQRQFKTSRSIVMGQMQKNLERD